QFIIGIYRNGWYGSLVNQFLFNRHFPRWAYRINYKGSRVYRHIRPNHIAWDIPITLKVSSSPRKGVVIIIGLYLPAEKNVLNEWIGSGFLLGGLITLFIGTALYFSDFLRWLRPIVILFELGLVIFISYRKLKK
ncbi:MAG: hypothetical protein ABIH34_01320, partial [Nanoarchaeota archaeon]